MAVSQPSLFQVPLVVLLSAPESLGRLDLGDNASWFEASFGGEFVDFGFGLRLLLRGVEEDRRAVLLAPVLGPGDSGSWGRGG